MPYLHILKFEVHVTCLITFIYTTVLYMVVAFVSNNSKSSG